MSQFTNATTEKTHYGQLVDTFNQSSATAKEELLGWWSGRCFRPQNPNQAFGTIIVGKNIEIQHGNPNDGPLFPPYVETIHHYNVFGRGFQGADAPAGYFDELNPEKTNFIESLISRGQLISSYSANKSLKIDFHQGNLHISSRSYIDAQTNAKYFLTRLQVMSNQPPYWAGDEFAICYFFKKVR